jgi:hypothetical protein
MHSFMKNNAILFFLCFFSAYVNAQNVAINLSGNTGSSSAIVDLSDASNKNLGFLMTNVELLSATDNTTVPNPSAGMIVWNTNDAMPFGVGFYYWSGAAWLYISNSGTLGLADLTAGTGITPFTYNGTSAQTISIATTGVTAGIYGSATTVPTYTVNGEGQITEANNVPIDITGLAPLNTGPLGAVLSSSPTNTATWTTAPSADNLVLLSNTAGTPVWGTLPASTTASNGLTAVAGNIILGGTLTQPTAITQSGNSLDISGGTISLNDGSSATTTNINTGTSTGPVNIGNGTNTTITEKGTLNINISNGAAATTINTGTSTGGVVIGNNTGFTGINQATPLTTLDVNGGLSTDVSSTIPSVPEGSTTYTITVGNSSFIQLTSSALFPEASPFTLGPGAQTGQRLVIELNSPTTSGAELLSGTNVSLLNSPILFGGGTGNTTIQSVELIWNGTAWVDLGTNITEDIHIHEVGESGGTGVWTCPTGVTSVLVKAWGAGGAGSGSNDNKNGGGGGAFVEAIVAVTAGQNYDIVVGQGGVANPDGTAYGGGGEGYASGGTDGSGGGGGFSGFFYPAVTQADALVVAGGGGGGASGFAAGNGVGGGGGAPNGGTGGGTACVSETGGGGGTAAAGGAAGLGGCTADNGNAGIAISSATTSGANAGAASTNKYGGGGGGGYYGGGSGGCDDGGGGGGGSSYVNGTTISMQAGSTGVSGASVNPGGTSDPAYISGDGVGSYGNAPGGTAGGNGLVIIYY